jgi:general L-amino acid transport system permease protein
MSAAAQPYRFVRADKVDSLPPPNLTRGPIAWARENLFSSPANFVLTVLAAYLVYLVLPPVIRFMIIDAVWTGDSRDACRVETAAPTLGAYLSHWLGFSAELKTTTVGACWAFIADKINYFVYGSYPIESRWRVNIVFALFGIGLFWLLNLKAPRRDIGAVFFFILVPLLTYVLLTGGNADFRSFLLGFALDSNSFIGPARNGASAGGIVAAIGAALGYVLSLIFLPLAVLGQVVRNLFSGGAVFWADVVLSALVLAGLAGILARLLGGSARTAALATLAGFGVLALLLAVVDIDWGLQHVPTSLWGGILVTLVVSAVGIVFSLPFGVLLALGRRSKLPLVRLFSVIFIEFVRGVPLITVLFMANTMLPLFLSGDITIDRLMRPLVGVAIFASAYMAEVVRGGLQAMPKGQYEGAMSLGLNYPQMMIFIILPQALRIVIPGIVNTFIGLFKDTTLVSIVGIFDLVRTIEASRVDPNWAAPTISYTGYAFAGLFYFLCCWGMSRYSIGVERRLAAGQKR